ncbi:hypothetical protein CR203_14615 [Salipaludibacillus neizhouensis]|uniref:YrhK domain-containing protein n=1 Tax=Salipaludibacillus neizhouensis TaxID=885475 RepID=A0A3A9KFV7_9BACI|nr:YrhK family protein [Salipaludibacillus neizhouensis]RKL66525.1 hypothetical protein CR203_14615 [Salipaludibacillus neizhouensis]
MLSIKNKEDILDIRCGTSRIVFKKQCRLLKTVNDVLIAFSFLIGSLLHFLGFAVIIGTILYLTGSLILAGRSIQSIKENIMVEQQKMDEAQQQESIIE